MTALPTLPISQIRPLALRRRADLRTQPLEAGGRRRWVVKDPVNLSFFELSEEEHAILELLAGDLSLSEVRRRFERQFAPQRLGLAQLQGFVARLHQDGLLISDGPGQADVLLKRARGSAWRALGHGVRNVFALRLRGIDPTWLLDRLYPCCRWMFSPWALAGFMLLVLGAAAWCLLRLDVLLARLPDFQAFFSPHNAIWFLAALALTKVLHELGHALTCRHFGGECHEMGLMFLVFAPCLYCDVSDAWLFPSRARRIAVSAAGMCVELVLASLCTIIWWNSEPGLLNALALQVMFVCSVGTLLFNGNPLLRFDGYYILSDLTGVPNLAQQSSDVVMRGLGHWFLGIERPATRPQPDARPGWLAAYGIAAFVYRWMVVLGLIWFAHQAARPYHMEAAVDLVALVFLGGLVLPPVWLGVRFLRDPLKRRQVRWPRAVLRVGLVMAIIAGAAIVPLPCRVSAPVVLEPADAERVYVPVAGTLLRTVQEGEVVRPGAQLAVLHNPELRLELAKLEGQRDQQRLRLDNLRRRSVVDPQAADEAPTAEKILADLEERLRRRSEDERRLTLTAPVGGTVLPPPVRPAHVAEGVELPGWSGTPLEPKNIGSTLETGTLVCLIGDPGRLAPLLVIDQVDVEQVAAGQRVRIHLDQAAGRVIEGTIAEIARVDLEALPQALAGSGELAERAGPGGIRRPQSASYQARVTLNAHGLRLVLGGKGQAQIAVAPQTLAHRLIQWLGRTFRFQW